MEMKSYPWAKVKSSVAVNAKGFARGQEAIGVSNAVGAACAYGASNANVDEAGTLMRT
jgi:hypothetical protein